MYCLQLYLLLGVIILGSTLTQAYEEYKDVLYKYGYIQQKRGRGKGEEPSKQDFTDAIIKFQEFNGLTPTGVFDKKTAKKMAIPRCGVPDIQPRGLKKWAKNDLTWFVEKFSKTSMKEKQQIKFLKKGLERWAKVTQLEFKEGESNSDLIIKFVTKEHGDGFPFDDEGGVLAHATYPESGKVHFDDSEDWQSDKTSGKNLEIVAAHEFGHSLGLPHSKVAKSLMAPYYQGYMENLHADDIEKIQMIYGANVPPTETPVSVIKFCGCNYTKINAAMKVEPKDSIILFVDDFYVIDGSVGRKKKIRRIFPKGPLIVHAAVFSKDLHMALLFSDNKVWSYSLSGGTFYRNFGYPKTHQDTNFSAPDAAMILRDYEQIERVFVIKGDKLREWITYDEELVPELTLSSEHFFIGIPKHIDAILSVNKTVTFISDQDYYTMDTDTQIVLPAVETKTSLLGGCTPIAERRLRFLAVPN